MSTTALSPHVSPSWPLTQLNDGRLASAATEDPTLRLLDHRVYATLPDAVI
jgi:hypothetical protein